MIKEEKFLEINQDMDKILTELCDAALKKEGMRLFGTVTQLISAIQKRDAE
jgi:hypothetical protein